MSAANDLAKMVPGFEFLQNLMKGASAGMPGVQGFGQWVAPTLDPAELDKRIQELKTVQFWLEQNARLLGTTVQALEVQRMTLSTLQTMNLPMADLREALLARTSAPQAEAPAPAPPPAAAKPMPMPMPMPKPLPKTPSAAAKAAAPGPGAVDPMQWWGALTQQFTEIAAKAVNDRSADVARHVASSAGAAAAAGAAAKAGLDGAVGVAGKTLKKAASLPAKAVRAAAPRRKT